MGKEKKCGKKDGQAIRGGWEKTTVWTNLSYINFKNATNITVTCCVFHNLFMSKKPQRYVTLVPTNKDKKPFSQNIDNKLKINFYLFLRVGGHRLHRPANMVKLNIL